MKRSAIPWIVASMVSGGSLTGCKKAWDPAAATDQNSGRLGGRYVGVGIYDPGSLWTKMVGAMPAPPSAAPSATATPNTAAANVDDDDKIILVIDSHTGEIRQCGNLSGYCVGMNPWTKALLASQQGPVNLTQHAADIRAADEAKAAEASKASASK